jgi:hypothetical protein
LVRGATAGWRQTARRSTVPNKTVEHLPGIDRWYQANIGTEPVVLGNKPDSNITTQACAAGGNVVGSSGGGNQKRLFADCSD